MTNIIETDISIIGGSLAGLTAAIGLAEIGLSVTVVDMIPIKDQVQPSFDGRSSAIAFASCEMLKALGIWKFLEGHAQPILDIRVSDGPSLMHLHFDHESLGEGPLGNMLENRHIREALAKRVEELENISVLAPESVENIERDKSKSTLTLKSGTVITSKLLLGIDGRQSLARRNANIPTSNFSYGQVGIVCSIEHEHSHCGIAHERFLPSGPFAILPLTGNRSSLVWTEKEHLRDTIMNLSDRAFNAEVKRRVGDFLGDIEVIGGRWAYPLTLQYSDTYISTRMALLGDAAHAIHPIAGQGLNMGLRDVAAFLEIISDSMHVGLEIGSEHVLAKYQEWRRFDNASLIGVTDILNRLFSNDIGPIKAARDVGLAVVDKIPPLKNFFMSHARGTVGELPKLLRGEPLL
ncbi:UbiH/UbiF/VisC/COQ6 family ubiquinone biosynthesis hydroxylase [Kordiimonas sp. SCSIO 12610]|nr:UbiH/UbiF/VisC/COQ6 family ubiquinone biosynthesis hydroxylase [Kordiimonas sp. SCSIO 12610]